MDAQSTARLVSFKHFSTQLEGAYGFVQKQSKCSGSRSEM